MLGNSWKAKICSKQSLAFEHINSSSAHISVMCFIVVVVTLLCATLFFSVFFSFSSLLVSIGAGYVALTQIVAAKFPGVTSNQIIPNMYS